MTDSTVIRFEDIEWNRKVMIGKGYGTRGKGWCYFMGRGPWVFEMETGQMPEKSVRLGIEVIGAAFQHPNDPIVVPVFTELGREAKLDYRSMFLSESGKDEWPSTGFGAPPRYRDPETNALKVKTKYLFSIPESVGGHTSLEGRHGIKLSYASLSQDNLDVIPVDVAAGIHEAKVIEGEVVWGTWYPDEI